MISLIEYIQLLLSEFKDIEFADVFRFKSFKFNEDFGPHRHKRIEINFVQKGACTMLFGEKRITFKANEMMIIFPLVEHRFIPHQEGVTLMQLEFMPDLFYLVAEKEGHNLSFYKEVFDEKGKQKYMKIINNIRLNRVVQRIIDELIDKKESYNLLVPIYYAELLILVSRQMLHPLLSTQTGPLYQALTIIQSTFTQSVSIKSVAEQCGVSERYLRRLFFSKLHTSYTEYINELKVEKAKELLHNTRQSVKEIAYLCGFNSVEYFTRVFKQHTGISPGQFST